MQETTKYDRIFLERGIPLLWVPWKYTSDWTRNQLTAAARTLAGEPCNKATTLEQYWLLHCLHPQELSATKIVWFRRVRDSGGARNQIKATSKAYYRENASSGQTTVTQDRAATSASTRREAPAVHQRPGKTHECSWCGEMRSASSILDSFCTSSCTHPSLDPPCRQCAQKYIAKRAISEDWTKIKCPEYQCNKVLQHGDMQKYASKANLAQYELILSQRAIESDLVQCAHRECEDGGLCDPQMESFFVCPTCSRKTCTVCQKVWHPSKTCAQHQAEEQAKTPEAVAAARAARRAEEEASARVVREDAVPCPNPHLVCPYWIQKSAGCDHMTCRQCGWEFCIKCMASLEDIKRHGNDAHRRYCPYHSDNLDELWQGHTENYYNSPLDDHLREGHTRYPREIHRWR